MSATSPKKYLCLSKLVGYSLLYIQNVASLIFYVRFDYLSYSKYEIKYLKLYYIFSNKIKHNKIFFIKYK
jgi:hypothetical protein